MGPFSFTLPLLMLSLAAVPPTEAQGIQFASAAQMQTLVERMEDYELRLASYEQKAAQNPATSAAAEPIPIGPGV